MKKSIGIIGINHVCLVVKDLSKSKRFFMEILGLEQHPKVDSWLIINNDSTLHLVNIPEAIDNGSLYHEVQHFALHVKDLKVVQERLFEYGLKPFQMDFNGNTHILTSAGEDLGFGIGTIFVEDDDRNLVEFIQLDKGIFAERS